MMSVLMYLAHNRPPKMIQVWEKRRTFLHESSASDQRRIRIFNLHLLRIELYAEEKSFDIPNRILTTFLKCTNNSPKGYGKLLVMTECGHHR